MNKLPVPLALHMEQLVDDFGLLEVFHSLIVLMKTEPACAHLINAMESLQSEISDIDSSQNTGAVQPEELDRPENQN